ncbi:MAG: DNA-binding response regulator [Verrucomicrobia bacterium]|nr:MAG: DNA-binding response regulator [Verrucomicrobiota bacterium]
MKKTRILIVDDHELVLRGLKSTIEEHPDWEVCGEAGTGREALEVARETRPDIIVLDFAMPDLNGLEAARKIRAELPDTEILMLTMHETESLVREALAAGVRSFILKSDAGRLLADAIESLIQGRPFFTGRVSQLILHGYLNPTDPAESLNSSPTRLSPREREVVQLIAEGKSTKEVATRLGISPKTAETHRTNIMRKLNLHSVTELVRFAIRNKIVEP